MKSYKEMVDRQIKHINEDNQQLTYLKDKFYKEQKEKKALAESLRQVGLKLQQTTVQTEIVMQHTKLLYQQNKEEVHALAISIVLGIAINSYTTGVAVK